MRTCRTACMSTLTSSRSSATGSAPLPKALLPRDGAAVVGTGTRGGGSGDAIYLSAPGSPSPEKRGGSTLEYMNSGGGDPWRRRQHRICAAGAVRQPDGVDARDERVTLSGGGARRKIWAVG